MYKKSVYHESDNKWADIEKMSNSILASVKSFTKFLSWAVTTIAIVCYSGDLSY